MFDRFFQFRIQALAQKQKSHDQARGADETDSSVTPTEPPPQAISPQPLPPIPETPHEATPPTSTPPRAATPLERMLLDLLSDADLGATGFLKANELKAVLLKLGKVRLICGFTYLENAGMCYDL